MDAYRIHFFNDLTNSSGHPFHCRQRVIEIRLAKSRDRAIEAAKRRFVRRENISHWHVRAHSIEVEGIGPRGEIAKIEPPEGGSV